MAVNIQFSRFDNRQAEELIRKLVRETFKDLPDDWTITITSNYKDPDWKMTVNGPQHFELEVTLEAGEHAPQSVVTAIKHVIVGELSG